MRITLLTIGLLAFWCEAARAAELSLAASGWQPFTGTGTLANVTDTLPGGVTATVLASQSAQGAGFGFVQANYAALRQTGRFVRATLKADGAFFLYVRVRGSNGADYYLSYASFVRPVAAAANGYLNYTLSADYPARQGAYVIYTLDVEGDLARLVPGVSASWIRWVAARGAMRLGRLEVLPAVDYLTADGDGDLLTGAAEDQLGTSPFLFDSDGDGAADGLENGNGCADPLDNAVPGNLAGDPDGDGIPSVTELFLGSDCAASGDASLPVTYGWEPYYPSSAFPAGATAAVSAGGVLAITHAQPSPLGFGLVNPPQRGRLRLPAHLDIARDGFRFSASSGETFYVYVRVKGSDGLPYNITYNSLAGSISYGNGYVTVPLGSQGYAFNGATFTLVARNLSNDLGTMRPGVTVSRVLWVAVRGRLRLRDVGFEAIAPPHPPAITLGASFAPAAGVLPGESGRITATVTDPDDDPVTVTWSVRSATAPGVECYLELVTAATSAALDFRVPARHTDVRCADRVTVKATASDGTLTAAAAITVAVAAPALLGAQWSEVPGNPVVPLSACPAWDCLGHSDPAIGRDTTGALVLWFSAGGDRGNHPVIGRAVQQLDGSFALSPAANPVIEFDVAGVPPSPLPWDYIRETVSVLWDPGASRWSMAYLGYMTDYYTDPAIGLVQSLDSAGTLWPRAAAPIYTPIRPGGWDAAFLTSPTGLLGSDGVWRIYFAGSSYTVPGGKVGVLTSTDGVTWTPAANNPIFSGAPGAWDESVIDAFVAFVGGRYLMWYSAFGGGELTDTTVIAIGLAESEDGFLWERVGTGPVITVGSTGAWNDARVLDPEVLLEEDGTLTMAGYGVSTVPPIPAYPTFKPTRLGLWRSAP